MSAAGELLPILGPGSWIFPGGFELLPILGRGSWIFPGGFDQGGPCAADRSISSIGALLPIEL
jgi:hypothetical protein